MISSSSSKKTKTPSSHDKSENEGIQRILSALAAQAGLILLFDGEVVRPAKRDETDEHSQTGILTSDLTSFPPSHPSRVARPDSGFGELVIRYSGATVPDSHGVPWHLTATMAGNRPPFSKNDSCYASARGLPRKKLGIFRMTRCSPDFTAQPSHCYGQSRDCVTVNPNFCRA